MRNTITPFKNGPLYIIGTLELKDGNGELLEKSAELYLCRCGHSNNKPYCDGQHRQTGFQDAGVFIKPPESEHDLANEGTLEIKVQANGPLLFRGVACIQDTQEQKIIRKIGGLCRCQQSSNRPFCDGTHTKIDFNPDD